jgi:hypothetical protein
MSAGTFTTAQFTVGTTASKIADAGSRGDSVRVRNTHATNTLFVGPDNTVTTGNGYPIPAGQTETFNFSLTLWAIASGAGTTVGVLGVS